MYVSSSFNKRNYTVAVAEYRAPITVSSEPPIWENTPIDDLLPVINDIMLKLIGDETEWGNESKGD